MKIRKKKGQRRRRNNTKKAGKMRKGRGEGRGQEKEGIIASGKFLQGNRLDWRRKNRNWRKKEWERI